MSTARMAVGAACEDLVVRNLNRLPPFSPVLNRLLGTLAKEDVRFIQLAELIEKDTVMAGNVLRLVNSALYGFSGTVNSVRHAVAILGVNKLRNVVLGLSITRMWRNVKTPEGWSGVTFNLHSVAAGLLADALAQRAEVPYPEGAFVAGLMHDVGKLLLAIAMPEEFLSIFGHADGTGIDIGPSEQDVIGTTHAALSAAALAKWNLPAPIREAVRFHHAPARANGGGPGLSHVVQAADRLAIDLGYPALPVSLNNKKGMPEKETGAVLEGLGLAGRVPEILEQFGPDFEAMRQFA